MWIEKKLVAWCIVVFSLCFFIAVLFLPLLSQVGGYRGFMLLCVEVALCAFGTLGWSVTLAHSMLKKSFSWLTLLLVVPFLAPFYAYKHILKSGS